MYLPRSVSPLKTLVLFHFLSVNPLQKLIGMRVAVKYEGIFEVFLMERPLGGLG